MQELILPLGEFKGLPRPEDLAAVGIDAEIPRLKGGAAAFRRGEHGGAADVGSHPGDELPHGKGLGDVVISADL